MPWIAFTAVDRTSAVHNAPYGLASSTHGVSAVSFLPASQTARPSMRSIRQGLSGSATDSSPGIAGSKLVVYPDAGHVPMEEIPEETARDAEAFLRAE